MNLSFTVYGVPQPQGSTRAFIPKGWKRPVITTDNAKLKPFRQELAQTALAAMREADAEKAKRGVPVAMRLRFYFEKPKSAKKSACWKVTKPDLDKLLRAVLDALTGIAYEDDSQVCECSLSKAFGSPGRVEIQVRSLEGIPKTLPEASPQLADSTREPAQLLAFGKEVILSR